MAEVGSNSLLGWYVHSVLVLLLGTHDTLAGWTTEAAVTPSSPRIVSTTPLSTGDPPVIILVENRTVIEGESASVACLVKGGDVDSLTWEFQGETLVSDDRVRIQSTNKIEVDITGVAIIITRVNREDAGPYTCTAVGRYGNASKIGAVTVEYAPIVADVMASNTYITKNETKRLSCTFAGLPLPVVTWYVGDKPMKHKMTRDVVLSDTMIRSSLKVGASTKKRFAGVYTCEAKNQHGSAYGVRHLTKAEVPDPPIDVITEFVTSNSIQLLIFPSLNYNGELAFGIDVKVTVLARTPFRWADHKEAAVVTMIKTSDEVYVNITNLVLNTTYQLGFRSVNEAGYSKWRNITIITKGPEAHALPRHAPLKSAADDDHINKMTSLTRKTTIIISVATTCVAVIIMICGAAALYMRSEKHDKRKQDGGTGTGRVYVIDAELEADDFDSLLVENPKQLINGDVMCGNHCQEGDESSRHLLRPLEPIDENIQDDLPPIEEVEDGGRDEVHESDNDIDNDYPPITANGAAKPI